MALVALSQSGHALSYFGEDIKNDYHLALMAILSWPKSLRFVSNNLKNNKDVVLTALRHDANTFQNASEQLQNDRELLELYISFSNKDNFDDKSKDFYKKCTLKLNILIEQDYLESNTNKSSINVKPLKF